MCESLTPDFLGWVPRLTHPARFLNQDLLQGAENYGFHVGKCVPPRHRERWYQRGYFSLNPVG